jgi:hypothetical protein
MVDFDKGIMRGDFFPENIGNFADFSKNGYFTKIIYTIFCANGNEIMAMGSIIISLQSG